MADGGLARWLHEPEGEPAPFPVVDAHAHVFPERVLAAIWRWFDAYGWPIRYRIPADDLLRFLASRGVAHAWGLHYSHAPGLARVLNAFVTDMAERAPLLIPFGTVLPGEPETDAIVRESLDGYGHAGLKLHCHVQKMAPDDPRLFPVCEALVERGRVLVLHAGREPRSPAYGFDTHLHCGAGPVRRLLERFPTLKLVVPHLGTDEWREFLALLRDFPSLHLDTTMAVSGLLTDDVPTAADLEPVGERILFGTDVPNIPYAWGRELRWLLALGLREETLRAVLHDNALRLVGRAP